MKLDANTADGIHRIEDAYTNWYIVEGGGTRSRRAVKRFANGSLPVPGVLTGHGEPLRDGAESTVARRGRPARRRP